MRCEFCGEPAKNDSYWVMFEGDRDETPTCELCYDRLVSHLEAETSSDLDCSYCGISGSDREGEPLCSRCLGCFECCETLHDEGQHEAEDVSELNWANYDNKAEVVDVVTDPTQNRVYVTVRHYKNRGRDSHDVIYSGDSKKAGLAAESVQFEAQSKKMSLTEIKEKLLTAKDRKTFDNQYWANWESPESYADHEIQHQRITDRLKKNGFKKSRMSLKSMVKKIRPADWEKFHNKWMTIGKSNFAYFGYPYLIYDTMFSWEDYLHPVEIWTKDNKIILLWQFIHHDHGDASPWFEQSFTIPNRKAMKAETPIMPPMGFGESVNWRPHEDQNRDRRRAETSDLDCDECGAVNETVGYVDDDLSFKLCEPCDRDWMAKQGYEAEMASLSEIIFEDEMGNKYTTHPDFDHSLINDMIWDEDLVPLDAETVRFNTEDYWDGRITDYGEGQTGGNNRQFGYSETGLLKPTRSTMPSGPKKVKMVDCMKCGQPEFADELIEESFCRKCGKELSEAETSETVRFNSASDAYAMAYSQGHAHGRRQQPYDPKLSKEEREVFTGAWKIR